MCTKDTEKGSLSADYADERRWRREVLRWENEKLGIARAPAPRTQVVIRIANIP